MGNNSILKLQQLNKKYLELKQSLAVLECENSSEVAKHKKNIDSYKKIGYAHVLPLTEFKTLTSQVKSSVFLSPITSAILSMSSV